MIYNWWILVEKSLLRWCSFSNLIREMLFTISIPMYTRYRSSFVRISIEYFSWFCFNKRIFLLIYLKIFRSINRDRTRKKMTSGYSVLQLKEDDVLKILAAQLHLGSKDVNYQMDTYVWKKKPRNEGWNSID